MNEAVTAGDPLHARQVGSRLHLQDLGCGVNDVEQEAVDVLLQRGILLPQLGIVVLQVCMGERIAPYKVMGSPPTHSGSKREEGSS